MWAVKNTTPFAAERNWVRDKDGAHVWIVAVKATFDVQPNGALTIADEQAPPVLAPVPHGDPALSSLKYDSDLLAVKPGTDVLLDGHAYAPNGVAVERVDVVMRVGGLTKAIVAYGERLYYEGAFGITTTSPRPFTRCPLRYEEAFGGADLSDPDPARQRIDPRNPVGRGVAAEASRLAHKPAHRLEYPSGNPSRSGPAGFGPIASYWSPRLELAGTYDAAWQARKRPLLPDDYDPAHALASPIDQRPDGGLRGGEVVELLNVTPDGGLRFALPRLYFTYRTRFGARAEEHRGQLVTVMIEPDLRRVMLTYQTSLTVRPNDVAYLDETVIGQKEYVR